MRPLLLIARSLLLDGVESGYSHLHSVIHDFGARDAAISAVDEEVDAARKLLRSLLTRRNALAPISVLPPEVLARVFHALARLEPPCWSGIQYLGWIRATHVCVHWRQVALGDSSLWARISGVPTSKEFVAEMLVRARNAPLDIDVDLAGTSNPALSLLFAPHISRIRELRLHSLSKFHSDSVRGIYGQEAPVLEHFELGVSVAAPMVFGELGGVTLFKGRAPKLRTLSLSQVLIPWSHIPRGQLTQLKIVFFNEVPFPIDVSTHDDVNQLIDLLVNSPELEVLVLESCLPSRLGQFPRSRTIHLPHLSRLCLGGSSSRVTNLLKMLKFPPSSMLHLHCISENTPTYNDHHLLPLISAHYQCRAPIEFKSLSVGISDMGCLLDVTASTILPRSKYRKPLELQNDLDSDNEFVLSLERLPDVGNWTGLLERVCKILPISNLDFFSICATDVVPVNSINWVELFKHCPNVATMQAIGRGTSSLVRALTSPNSNSNSNSNSNLNSRPGGKGKKKKRDNRGSAPAQSARGNASHAHTPLFPKLTYLALKQLDFGDGVLFDVVVKGLHQRRAACKAPFKSLRVECCNISPKRAKALEKLVQDFHWDGEECYLDESADYEDFDEYDSDFIVQPDGERWQDYFIGTSQTEWDWWENHSDGY
jgi:hypothetical protein